MEREREREREMERERKRKREREREKSYSLCSLLFSLGLRVVILQLLIVGLELLQAALLFL